MRMHAAAICNCGARLKGAEPPTPPTSPIVCFYRRFRGTEGYAAPEVAAGRTWAPEADMWSVGVVFYALLANELLRWKNGLPEVSTKTSRAFAQVFPSPSRIPTPIHTHTPTLTHTSTRTHPPACAALAKISPCAHVVTRRPSVVHQVSTEAKMSIKHLLLPEPLDRMPLSDFCDALGEMREASGVEEASAFGGLRR